MGYITKYTKGYTFVELMVAMGIFSVVLVLTTTITINFNNTQKRERARNMLIEETQFLLNRISNMIRDNQIDYAEYYSNSYNSPAQAVEDPVEYGNDPKEYEWRFYYLPTCQYPERHADNTSEDGIACDRFNPSGFDEGFFDSYADNNLPALNDDRDAHAIMAPDGASNADGYHQHELYLISVDGTTKTILKRLSNNIDDDDDGQIDEQKIAFWEPGEDLTGNDFTDGGERLGMLQLVAEEDLDDDGELDFIPAVDFQTDGDTDIEVTDFIPITPKTLDIVDLKFYIAPLDDPRKATDETGTDVQMQPHVTIVITTKPGAAWRRNFAVGEHVSISLQTTISSRVISNVIFPDP